jgi:hypothetical protein
MKVLSLLVCFAATVSALALKQNDVASDLKNLVPDSSVNVEVKARWSDYNAPLPSVTVTVQAEKDIAKIVSSTTRSHVFAVADDYLRSSTAPRLVYPS